MNTEEILYICTSCGIKENIPKEVVEYFDEMDQSNINEPPRSLREFNFKYSKRHRTNIGSMLYFSY